MTRLLAAVAAITLLAACGAAGDPQAADSPTSTSETTATSAEEVSYASCAVAITAGAAPIHEGEPGYSRTLDGDGDGIACEQPNDEPQLEADTLALVSYLIDGDCPSDQILADFEAEYFLVVILADSEHSIECTAALASVVDFLGFPADWSDQMAADRASGSLVWNIANDADTWLLKSEPWCGPSGCEDSPDALGFALRFIDMTEGPARPSDLVEATKDL